MPPARSPGFASRPLDEPYRIPASTASAIRSAQAQGARIIAIGTTVVRALAVSGDNQLEAARLYVYLDKSAGLQNDAVRFGLARSQGSFLRLSGLKLGGNAGARQANQQRH